MKSMRDLLAIVDQNRQNLNENIQTAPTPGVPQLGYNEFDPEPAVDPDDPSLSLPDRFTDGDDSIDVPMNFDNKEDGDVLKEQGSQDQDVITRADAIWEYTPYDIKVENEKYGELVDLIDQGEFDGLDVQEAAGKFMQMVDPRYEPSDSQGLTETRAKHGDGRELYVGIEAYGIKGMKSTPWRKRFKSQAAFEKWLNNTEDDVEVLGTREVNLNDSLTKEGVAEGGPFSYGAKKPRKGSVAYNAELERKKRERNQPPIEPKDQMVGTAKVTKDVKEGVVPDHWPANWRDNWEKRDRWPQREIENAIKQYNEIAQQPMVQYEITPKMSDELRAAKLSIQRDKYYGGVAFAEIILRQNIDHDTIGNPSSWGIPFLQGFYDVVKTMDNPLRTIIRRALIDKKQHWEGEDVGQEKSWPSRVGPGKQGVAEGFAGEKVGQKPGDQVRGTEKAKSSKTRHPFQGRLVGGAMESQTYYIKHRGTGEIFESFDNLARAQRRYSQLGELQADYRLTKKR